MGLSRQSELTAIRLHGESGSEREWGRREGKRKGESESFNLPLQYPANRNASQDHEHWPNFVFS